MTDYTNLLERLAVSAGDQECLYADAKEAIEALQARVAELESRLEISPEHDIDGIAARDATIKLQDGRIAELKSECSELQGMAGAMDMFRSEMIDSGVIDINVPPMFFSESVIPRLLRLADMEKQEPALYVQSDHIVQAKFSPFLGRICQQPFDGPPMTRLYAAPPVAAPVRLTDGDMLDSLNETAIAKQAACGYPSMRNLLDLARAIETGVLRANGFKVEGEK